MGFAHIVQLSRVHQVFCYQEENLIIITYCIVYDANIFKPIF